MIRWLINFLTKLVEEKFTGSIQINFFGGGISNINKNESIKPQPKKEEGE